MRTSLRLKRPGAFRQAIAQTAGPPLAGSPRAFAFLCPPPSISVAAKNSEERS